MDFARLHLRFWILLGVLGLAHLWGAWWCLNTRRELLLVQGGLAAKRRELQSLRRQMPGIASDTPERISSELEKAEKTRRSLRSTLAGEAIAALAVAQGLGGRDIGLQVHAARVLAVAQALAS